MFPASRDCELSFRFRICLKALGLQLGFAVGGASNRVHKLRFEFEGLVQGFSTYLKLLLFWGIGFIDLGETAWHSLKRLV